MNVLEEMTVTHGEKNSYRIDHSYTDGLTETQEQAIQRMLDMFVAAINNYLNPTLEDKEIH